MFIVVDVETANEEVGSICQIGMVTFDNGRLVESWQTLINPEARFAAANIGVHGITPAHVAQSPTLPQVHEELIERLRGQIVVHHTPFDRRALRRAFARYGLSMCRCKWVDSAEIVRAVWPQFAERGYALEDIAPYLGITFQHHDAREDARATGEVVLKAIAKSGIPIEQWAQRQRPASTRRIAEPAATPVAVTQPAGQLQAMQPPPQQSAQKTRAGPLARVPVWQWVLLIVLLPFACLAMTLCNVASQPKPTPAASKAPVAQGPVATRSLTPTATATPTATPSVLPFISATPLPSVTPSPSATPCPAMLAFVADVSLPDGAPVEMGMPFQKTWRVKNTGACPWDRTCHLAFVGGEEMAYLARAPLPEIAPGVAGEISVSMRAPQTPGSYRSEWQLCCDDGSCHGPRLSVVIQAGEPATPTPRPLPTAQYQVGSTISTATLDVKIADAQRATVLTWSDFGNAVRAQGEFILVYLDVTNKAASPKALCSFSWLDDDPFTLTSGGRTFLDYNDNFTISMWRSHVGVMDPDSLINPGNTIRTVLVFDVTAGVTDLWLTITPLKARALLFPAQTH